MDDKQPKTFKPFIKLKDEDGTEAAYYSLLYAGIPDNFKDVALKELNETEENKRMGISKLRKILEEKNITDVEDHILLTVLRNCKFHIKNSEKKLMIYLKFINRTIEWLQTADLKRLESVFEYKVTGLLPYRDKYGRTIIYTTPYDYSYPFDVEEVALGAFCLSLYALSSPLTTVTGVALIIECNYPSMSPVLPATKTYIRYAPTFIHVPIRFKRIDITNEFSIIKWGYNIIRPILPLKLTKRIEFHGSNMQNLQKFYNPAILPEEFGGSMSPMNPEYVKEDVLNFVEKLKSRKQFIIK